MPIVAMPDNTQVSFPDEMPADQIRSMILQKFPDAGAAPSETPPIGPEIASGVADAIKSGVGQVADALNPFSEARHASYAKQASASPYDALKENLSQIGGVGSALATPVTMPGNVAGAIATPLVAHPFQALNQAAGINLPYDQAKEQAATALMGIKPAGASPIAPKTIPPAAPTEAALKSAATSGYDAVKNSGLEFKPSSIQDFATKTKADLNTDGIDEILAPKTFGVIDKAANPPEGSTVTVNNFRTLQRTLGNVAKSPDPTEQLAASRAIQALNDHIENIPASDLTRGTPQDAAQVSAMIKEANANYGAYKRSQDFNLRGDKAQNNAAAANSGMNLENNLRSQVRQILNNPKLQRGYNAEQLAALKEFNNGSRASNVLRSVGNILGGGGGWSTLINGMIGHAVAGPLGAALEPAIGFGIKSAGNARAARDFSKLGELLRANSPLARSLPPQVAPAPVISGLFATPRLPMPFLGGQIPAYANPNQKPR